MPEFIKKYFWEYALECIDLNVHKSFVIERLLEKGDFRCIMWLLKNYNLADIASVLHSKNISTTTRNLWQNVLLK